MGLVFPIANMHNVFATFFVWLRVLGLVLQTADTHNVFTTFLCDDNVQRRQLQKLYAVELEDEYIYYKY